MRTQALVTEPAAVAAQCRQLLSQRGELSRQALATSIVEAVQNAPPSGRRELIEMLAADFSPDPLAITDAANAWLAHRNPDALRQLTDAVEPPRQELFRRLNAVPGGTTALVRLRADALDLARVSPDLDVVAGDLKHLFASWFNHGFLQLEEISWKTPADILERVSTYEAVHEMNGWKDLRNRLAPDRRYFAFFHPALPREPLAFIAVALTLSLPATAAALIRQDRDRIDPQSSNAAIFYSITNAQAGLRGISFGAFLIKRVMSELARELPDLEVFATLSPMRDFAAALASAGEGGEFTDQRLQRLLGRSTAEAMRGWLGSGDPPPQSLAEPLRTLGLAYLSQLKAGTRAADAVAHFHLANGARIERINSDADTTEHAAESCGLMVNYRYMPHELEANRNSYLEHGRIAVAPEIEHEVYRVSEAWGSD